jgi:hypothetical protein
VEPIEAPRREQVIGHECVCALVNGTGLDSCHATVMNPDQPFCDWCEQIGHADLVRQRGGMP